MAKKSKKQTSRQDEFAELEKSYKKTAGKYAKKSVKKSHNGLVIAICILIPVLLIGALGFYFFTQEVDDNLIMDNVSIAGIDVGGMTKEEAISAVQFAVIDQLAKQPMVVTVLDQQLELTPDLTGVTLDAEAAVEAAYALGRTGDIAQRKEEQLRAATKGIQTDISAYLTVNADSIRAKLGTLDIAASGALVPSTWEVTGEAPDLQAEEQPTQAQTLVVTIGQPEYHYDQEKLVQDILAAYLAGKFRVNCDCDVVEPETIDLDAIYTEYCTETADAQMDPETFEVSSHTYGHAFDLEAAKKAVAEAEYGQVMEFPFTITSPKLFAKELSSVLFRDTLSSYTSYQASNSSRAENMQIACKAINGTVLLPGEVFSFNGVVGERTAAKGYNPAPTYEGGKTVMTYGGGICQPSSTIYYCALLADMEIVERDCHSYPSVYVPWGMDATVYWGSLDFKFRNNTEYPLRIDASADSRGNVSIALIGTDTKDHYVKMESEILAYYPHEVKEVPFSSSNNPNGYTDGQEITSPIDGYKVRTYRCRYDKETNELIEKVFEADSIYSKRNQEIAVQTDKETEPPATEPSEPTEPPVDTPTDPPVDTPTDPPVDPPVDTPADPPVDPPAVDPPVVDPPVVDSPDSGGTE